jgi:DNA repair protein RecN (Recombination protein N)
VLSELTVSEFAIIDELHVRFEPGFNVLTGETGAGKSIIIDAVSLLLGGRGGVDLIRSGADRSIIEGTFLLNGAAKAVIEPLLQQDGLEGDDPAVLVLGREIRRGGRNVCRVNGRAVTLRVLTGIGHHLVDIHGQTEHLSLMRVREHLELLDRFGELGPLRSQMLELVQSLGGARHELADLRSDERELARRVDLLEYQVREIEAARLEQGEQEALTHERARLANAEQLTELADKAYNALYGGSADQPSAIDLLQSVSRALAGLARLDMSTSPLGETAETMSYQLEDLAGSLRDYRDQVESNPRRLDQVEDRLALLRSLQRRYGDSVEEVLSFSQRAQAELEAIEHSGERIEELELEEERLLREIGVLGADLSARRREAGGRLAAGIEAELEKLNMARARFGVDLKWRDVPDGAYIADRRVAFDRTGLDRAEFLVAPNVGEPLKPLVRIASGGETSRLMLALKTVLAHADRTPTLIFDEIDAGIGGRVGGIVGQKLWGLTAGEDEQVARHQVLCVTHLPQLASYGDLHLEVRKRIAGDRTVTGVRSLDDEEREQQIAGMLGAVTPRTLASARELLADSHAEKNRQLASN